MIDVIAIGIGLRQNMSCFHIEQAIKTTLLQIPSSKLLLVATLEKKVEEHNLVDVMQKLSLSLILFPREKIASVSTLAHSPKAFQLFGISSVSEGAALLAAGQEAYLLFPRQTFFKGITVAVAVGKGIIIEKTMEAISQ